MHRGYVKIFRQISENELWTAEPFTRGQAWVDLVMLANHKDGYIRVRGNRIEVKRGQVGWSQHKLSDRWKWSRTKVRNFLNELEKKEQQIVQQKNKTTSLITLNNYEKYQSKSTTESTTDVPTEVPQKDTNKNDKNEKNKNRVDANALPGPRPKRCKEEDWKEYFSFSQEFLKKQNERWGAMCKPTHSKAVNGAKAIDNLIRVQGFNRQTVYETIEWARNNNFWAVNILSLAALTKKGRNGEIKFTNILASRAKEINSA